MCADTLISEIDIISEKNYVFCGCGKRKRSGSRPFSRLFHLYGCLNYRRIISFNLNFKREKHNTTVSVYTKSFSVLKHIQFPFADIQSLGKTMSCAKENIKIPAV